MFKNEYCHFGHKTLKLAVTQEGINGINFLHSMKARRCYNNS